MATQAGFWGIIIALVTGLIAVLQQIFIQPWKTKVADLESDLDKCAEAKEVLTRNYQNLLDEKNALILTMSQTELELYAKIKNLTEILAASLKLPDISAFVASPVEFKPYQTDIGIPMGLIADETYYLFSLDQWIDILTEIQAKTKTVLKKWKTDISDCDDWALVLNGFAVTAFANAGLSHQGCLLFVRSRTHAFNLFVAYDGDGFLPYIYEPQTNKVICRLDELDTLTADEIALYTITEGWLLGGELPTS